MVDQRILGVDCPEVTPEVIEYALNRRMLSVTERADRLLTYLAEEANELGWLVEFTDFPPGAVEALGFRPDEVEHAWSKPTNLRAYAWSESDNWDAVRALLDHLERRGLISLQEQTTNAGIYAYAVNVEGYARVEQFASSTVSTQAFVAMWFDGSMDDAYENGIAPAIAASGYDAKVINRDLTVDKIDDAIIAEIRKSKFIVADFTHGDSGARGGVYFEAGFAMGLGIPVIFTCRHDMVEKLHFDTRQYNHIVWNDSEELRQQLQDRIQARIPLLR